MPTPVTSWRRTSEAAWSTVSAPDFVPDGVRDVKPQRQAVILRLIRQHRVASQEHLRDLLRARGIEVTQATLSRDVRELRLAKVTDREGGSHYAAPAEGAAIRPPLQQLLRPLLLSLHGVGPLLVAKTPAGSANALAEALDAEGWPEVVGTIAGDNTILVIASSEAAQRALQERLSRKRVYSSRLTTMRLAQPHRVC